MTDLTPALKMSFLADGSGGHQVDVLHGVTPFQISTGDLASPVSARLAFAKVAVSCGEIVAKVAPTITMPFTPKGEIGAMAEIVVDDAGISIDEANAYRLDINGYIETTAYFVAKHADAAGIVVPYRLAAFGPFMVTADAFDTLTMPEQDGARPALSKVDMDAALATWADCLASMAAVVNASPVAASTASTIVAPADAETAEEPVAPAATDAAATEAPATADAPAA